MENERFSRRQRMCGTVHAGVQQGAVAQRVERRGLEVQRPEVRTTSGAEEIQL